MSRHGAHEVKKENTSVSEPVSEAPEKEKKKISKGTRVLIIIACVVLGLALLMVGTVVALNIIGGSSLRDDGENMDVSGNADVLENGTVRYKGQLYRYNDEITAILLMGIDDNEKAAEFDGVYGENNQSDANLLAVLDPVNGKMTLITISRDTMCEIKILDEDGNYVGPADAQLAVAYSYGDGAERSCELTCDAVSGIFHGIGIPAYGSIYMDGIYELVDLVGGVEVTPEENYGPFTAGQTVTLKGSLTETYIRHRAHTTEGNNERMERQKQVILALVRKGLSLAKDDPFSIPELYRSVSDNVTTNIDISKMVYLAKTAVGLDFDGEIYKVQGESVLGEDGYAEYIIDEDALFELIINVFYIPVEG